MSNSKPSPVLADVRLAAAAELELRKRRLLARAKVDPLIVFTEALGIKPRPWQRRVCELIRQAIERGETSIRIVIRTCHGAGKTFLVAGLVGGFVACHKDSRCLTTAPSWAAVENLLWPEINRLWAGSKFATYGLGTPLNTSLELGPGWYAVGASSDKPEKLEGHHSPTAAMRVVDEAKAVPDGVFVSTNGMLDAPFVMDVWISTPSIRDGRFFDRDVRNAKADDGVIRVVVTNDDLIRDAEADGDFAFAEVRRRWAAEQLETYGSADDPQYRARVMAEYIDVADGAAFPYSWLERAMGPAWEEPFDTKYLRPVLGVDCAGSVDGDETVAMLKWQDKGGRVVAKLAGAWREADTMVSKGRILALAREHNAYIVRVDSQGLGKGIYDALKSEFPRVEPYRAAAPAGDKMRFVNRKAEDVYRLRALMERDQIRIPNSPDLKADAVSMRYEVTSAGKIRVIDPDVALGGVSSDSPDHLDALLIATAPAEAYSLSREEEAERRVEAIVPVEEIVKAKTDDELAEIMNMRYQAFNEAQAVIGRERKGTSYSRRFR